MIFKYIVSIVDFWYVCEFRKLSIWRLFLKKEVCLYLWLRVKKYFWGLKESYRTMILYYMLVSCLLHCRTLDITTVLWVEWWNLYFKMEKTFKKPWKTCPTLSSCEWLILEFESRYIWFCSAKFFIECLQWCWALVFRPWEF